MKIIINSFYFLKLLFIHILIFKSIKTEKEIDLSSDQTYSFNYIDKNIENIEVNTYFFTLKQNSTIKFGISSSLNTDESISINIYKKQDNELININNFNLVINNILYFELESSEEIPIEYYIKYNYKKLHDMLFTLSYIQSNIKEEIYSISPTKYNNYIYHEYYSLEDYYIYFRVILYSFNTNTKIPIIITGDLSEEKINYYESNNFQETPDEIIQKVGNSEIFLQEKQYVDKQKKKLILYYDKKQDYNILNFKLRVNNNNKKGIRYIGISFVYKEIVLNNYGKQYMKNTGLFCLLYPNNIKYSTNTTLIVYTNVTSSLKIYEINSDQENQFIFGNNNNKYINMLNIGDNKISFINVDKDIKNEKDYLLFMIDNANEDFMFQFFFIENNNINYHKFENRNENINFIREAEQSSLNKDQEYFIINEFQNNDEKYIYFIDLLYGDYKFKTINLDSEIYNNFLFDENLYNPHLINSGAEISIFKIEKDQVLYGYNEYKIKCDNYNNKNLQKGDSIYICLLNNEIIELNMPNGDDIKFIISLMLYNKTEFSYIVGINNYNQKFQYNLTNSENQLFKKWNDEVFGNKIIINNYNQIPILISLKINAEESYIKKFENSQKEIKIEKNIIYALLLPKNSNQGKIYGVYQEIFCLSLINNLCLFYDFNDNNNEVFFFLPNASCHNNINQSKDLNITNYGIYSNDENKYFYTYIFYNGEEDLFLNYKHMIISNSLLEYKKINYFEESYNIIYYIINENKQLESNFLFLQLIKENKTDLANIYIQSQENNIFNTDLYYYNNINIINSYNKGSIFQLQNDLNLVFKFYETKKSLFYYEFGNSLSYNYNNDESLKVELIKDSKNEYTLKFKPFEKEGMADYELFIFNSTSEYTLDMLSNSYNIYNLEFNENVKKISFENIKSSDDDFSDDIKSKFILNFGEEENYNYNILLVGIKNNPNTKKFYTPIQISSLKIKFSNIKNTFCFNPNFNEENKSKINLEKDIYPNEDGNLIVQWIDNSIKDNQKLIIYKGIEEEKNIIYSSKYNEYSYLLNTNFVDNNFDILYTINDNNNTDNKICFQYISSSLKEEYDNSEIEYKYFTSIILPYFIKSKTNLEIFKFKFNQNIINDINIKVDYYKNNEIILTENYYQNNIKNIENDYYFGIYNNIKNTSISLKINLIINNLDAKSDLESFKIEWIKPNPLSANNSYNINFKTNPDFYFIDLNEYIGKNKALLLFTNLYNKKGFKYFKGNYFRNDSKMINKPFYSFDLEEMKDNNLLTFIIFSEENNSNNNDNNGIIDVLILNGKFITNENCDRFSMYNKNININKKEEVNNICYYTKENNIKGKFLYSITPKNENCKLFYLNNLIYEKNSVADIIDILNNNIISENLNNIFFGEIEIFKYKYDSNNNINLKLEFYENSEVNKTLFLEDIESNCFCDNYILSKNKKLILNLNNFSQAKGLLIIQWISNSTNNNQQIKIYQGKQENNNILYNSSFNEHSYLLNVSLVENIFDIIYTVNDNNNIFNKICLQYISFKGKDDYDNSEVEYKYITSLNLLYFINSNEIISKFEIFRIKFNNSKIKDININLKYFDNNKEVLEKNFSKNDLKETGDNYFYFGLFSLIDKQFIHINIYIDTSININEGPYLFKIKRIKCREITESKKEQYIEINKITKFYFFDLNNKYQNNSSLLIYTKLYNKKGFNFYMGNYFKNNSTNISKPLYSYNLKEIQNYLRTYDNENILTFMTFSSKDKKISEIIDLSIIEGKFIINEDCNRYEMYNKDLDILKGKEEIYQLCYYKSQNNIKGDFNYKIKDISNVQISLYYISNFLNKNYISEILSGLEQNNIKGNEKTIFYGEIELLKYNYNSQEDFKLIFEFTASEIQEEIFILGDNKKPKIFEKILKKGKKYVLNIIKKDNNENGFLIIQWINNSTINSQELKIYKGKEQENNILYNSTFYQHSYLLNTSFVEENFEITYIVNDNNNIYNKICLQYISLSENDEYGDSEIEYKYFTSLNLPYFINDDKNKINNEILEFNYNKNTMTNLEISIYNLINGVYILDKNYSDRNLKDIGNDCLYLGINRFYKKSYINVKLNLQNENKFSNEESFFIHKKKLNNLNAEYQTKFANNRPHFYLMNLTEILKPEDNLIFYSNLLTRGLTIYKNNFFLSDNNNINKIEKSLLSLNSQDIITLILYSNIENKGFIDFHIINDTSSLLIEENCDIEITFNKTYFLIKDKYYIICYNKYKNENNKYYLTYKIKNSNDNVINVYYSDSILSKNSINDILEDLSNRKLKSNENKLIKEDFEISILKYEYIKRNEEDINLNEIKFIINKFDDPNDKENYEKSNNNHFGLVSAFLFLSLILFLIIYFWFRNKNKKEFEPISNINSSHSINTYENEKDAKKINFL